MIRVTVPRPVADALMPRPCPCIGQPRRYGNRIHAKLCDHPDGSLPPVLRLLVVEGEPWVHLEWPRPGERSYEVRPPADLVRAIEAGERIGIDVECECACHRLGSQAIAADCRCTVGRVPVGSVRPVRVLPTYAGINSPPYDGTPFVYVTASAVWLYTDDGEPTVTDLSLYGPAESLVGRFAVEVEDARREP